MPLLTAHTASGRCRYLLLTPHLADAATAHGIWQMPLLLRRHLADAATEGGTITNEAGIGSSITALRDSDNQVIK